MRTRTVKCLSLVLSLCLLSALRLPAAAAEAAPTLPITVAPDLGLTA